MNERYKFLRLNDGYWFFSVLLCYFLCATLITWPLLANLDTQLFGDYSDARGGIWWLWAKTNGLLETTGPSLVGAPFNAPAAPVFSQPITEWLLITLARLFSEITAYNIFVFLSFPLTAIATYFFLDRLLHNRLAAIFGGLVFGFCPAAVMQAAGGHAAYSFNVFTPLFLLALFNNRLKCTIYSAVYVGVTFALITLTALYFGYFSIYIAIFFFVFHIFNEIGKGHEPPFRNYIYAIATAVLLILPFEYKAIYQQFTFGNDVLAKAGNLRDFSQLLVYSARPWEYLLPSIDHPFLGGSVQELSRAHLHGSNIPEQTLFLGLSPIGLLLTGIILVIRGKLNLPHRTYFLFFAFAALWMFFLSLPPLLSIGGVDVPTVSYFAYLAAPMFRAYARFGILVNFFVACASAVVLTHLYQNIKRVQYYVLLAILLPVLMFEYWSVPPNYALAVDQAPEVYHWLAKEPDEIIVAEYPMTRSDEFAFYTYQFWQRIHKKRLVNGASPDNTLAWDFFEKVKDLDDPATPMLLKSMGVKYVILHTKMYAQGPIPEPLKRYFPIPVSSSIYDGGISIPFPLKLSKTFGADMVFSLDAVPSELGAMRIFMPVTGVR